MRASFATICLAFGASAIDVRQTKSFEHLEGALKAVKAHRVTGTITCIGCSGLNNAEHFQGSHLYDMPRSDGTPSRLIIEDVNCCQDCHEKLFTVTNIASPEGCEERCQQTSGCLHFSVSENLPVPKPEVSSPQTQPDVASLQPQPEVSSPQPQPEVSSPQPQPEVSSPNWELVLKSTGDAVLGYNSPYWTNTNLLNTDSAVEEEANAKYAAFNNVAFTTIRLCVGSPSTNCYEHTLSSEHSSAHSLFSGEFIRDIHIDQSRLIEVLGSPGIRTCAMQRPGFNIECTDGNKARFGFCVNKPSQPCQESDGNDSDAALGIGLKGDASYLTGGESGEQGAGWTKFTHNTLAIQKNVWLWVDAPLPPTESPSTSTYGSQWTLVLQYGDVPYTPTSAAVGIPSQDFLGFAKLSDASINSLPSGGDDAFDYFLYTSDPVTAGASTRDSVLLRHPHGAGLFNDEMQYMGLRQFGDMAQCVTPDATSLEDCTEFKPNPANRFDTFPSSNPGDNCDRWFMDIRNDWRCYSPYSSTQRCFSRGKHCPPSYSMRINVQIYKLTA